MRLYSKEKRRANLKRILFLFFTIISFTVNGANPGKAYKSYIKNLQKNKNFKGTVKVGDGIYLNLSNASEQFVFKYMDVKVLKEIVKGNRGEVYFIITWPLKSITIGSLLKKEERKGLKRSILMNIKS